MGIWYVTREGVKSAVENVSTRARDNASVDRAIDAASRAAEGICGGRVFYPTTGTRSVRWPDPQGSAVERLWLDFDLISLTSITTDNGDTVLTPADVLLEPNESGPPYDRLEVDLSTSAVWSAGDTWQRAVRIVGVFGYGQDEEAAGALASSPNASTTAVTVTDASLTGVGDILRVGTERMRVTGRTWATSAQTLTAGITADKAVTSFAVADGTALHTGEEVLVDAEKMLITDIAGNTIIVTRSTTNLAVHLTGATVYAARALTVVRGVLGTTAAAHTAADPLLAYRAPSLVRQYVLAQSVATLNQQGAAYAAQAGSGDNQREVTGRALVQLEKQLRTTYGRRARIRAV